MKANSDIDKENLMVYAHECRIDNMPESLKAGEVLDLSKYAKCGTTKSSCKIGNAHNSQNVIPETDKDFKYVFGNAYAGQEIYFAITNEDSYLFFYGTTNIVENSNAPAAPGEADGDIPVDDVSGTITSAESAKDFDAQEVRQTGENTFELGEKVKKEDLKLRIDSARADSALYDTIAKADKTFKKDKARLLAYNITLSSDNCDRFKLTNGINITLRYPSDMAKDWNKYNYKVYHFVTFDYKKLENLEKAKIEEVKCTADKNGVHFTAPSFSNYVISVTPKERRQRFSRHGRIQCDAEHCDTCHPALGSRYFRRVCET